MPSLSAGANLTPPLVPSCRYLGCTGYLEKPRRASLGIGEIGESATHQLLFITSYGPVMRTREWSAYIYLNATKGRDIMYVFWTIFVDQAEYCRVRSKVLPIG